MKCVLVRDNMCNTVYVQSLPYWHSKSLRDAMHKIVYTDEKVRASKKKRKRMVNTDVKVRASKKRESERERGRGQCACEQASK